jgi:hypothetical protein
VNVVGRHLGSRYTTVLEWRKLVALKVKLSGRSEPFVVNRVADLTQGLQVGECGFDLSTGVASLDFYEYQWL